jgi:hypothetical protein
MAAPTIGADGEPGTRLSFEGDEQRSVAGSFASHRHTPSQLIEEVQKKDDVMVRLLLCRHARQDGHDAFAIRGDIVGCRLPDVGQPLLGPYSRLFRLELISLYGIGCHHDLVLLRAEK